MIIYILLTIIVVIIFYLIFCIISTKENFKLKGGSPTAPNFGSAVWNELYFSVPRYNNKNKDNSLINFLKAGIISCNDGKILDKYKEFKLHNKNLKKFDKNNYKINHYRIIFYDKTIHTKQEDNISLAISRIPFKAEGIETYDENTINEYYSDKFIDNIKKSPIYKKTNDDNLTYRQLRYEQVINAIFEYWFHICQYNYYYKTNHTNEYINSNLVSDHRFKDVKDIKDTITYDNKFVLKIDNIKDGFEFLVYNDKMKTYDKDSNISELKEDNKFDVPFKKLPYEWTINDIKYICNLYLLYLQLVFGDNINFKDANIKINDSFVDINYIKNLVSVDEFKNCFSKVGNIEKLNYTEILNSGINFANISYTIDETIDLII